MVSFGLQKKVPVRGSIMTIRIVELIFKQFWMSVDLTMLHLSIMQL
jgi:hypothetical protein